MNEDVATSDMRGAPKHAPVEFSLATALGCPATGVALARLRIANDDGHIELEPEHVVGRSEHSRLCIDDARVSSQHAMFRWAGGRWHLRDLGSRNGTYIDDTPLRPGEDHPIQPGERVTFAWGGPKFVVNDDTPPRVMVVPLEGGRTLYAEEGIIGIPLTDEPRATIYCDGQGRWTLEADDRKVVGLEHRQTFEIDGHAFRFSCPETCQATATVAPRHEAQLRFHFFVSRDEEHVEVEARSGTQTLKLGSRGYNYLLLTLARARANDERQGVPPTSAGWLYQDELIRGLSTNASQFNLSVFRLRQNMAKLGIPDANSIVERRPLTKQVRFGFANPAITLI